MRGRLCSHRMCVQRMYTESLSRVYSSSLNKERPRGMLVSQLFFLSSKTPGLLQNDPLSTDSALLWSTFSASLASLPFRLDQGTKDRP